MAIRAKNYVPNSSCCEEFVLWNVISCNLMDTYEFL
jgi:hypothetical protein